MASIGPHTPAHLLARTAEKVEASAAGQPQVSPSVKGHAQTPSRSSAAATIIPPAVESVRPIVPRYEEEEEEDEDEDGYTPELPPDLAAARANPNAAGARAGPESAARRAIGPARGPFRREEEEEEESEEEIGPAPLPLPLATYTREDAVAEFMQKEAQRRQAIEVSCVSLSPPLFFFLFSSMRWACTRVRVIVTQLLPVLRRRQPVPRRFSVRSGCSSHQLHQIC